MAKGWHRRLRTTRGCPSDCAQAACTLSPTCAGATARSLPSLARHLLACIPAYGGTVSFTISAFSFEEVGVPILSPRDLRSSFFFQGKTNSLCYCLFLLELGRFLGGVLFRTARRSGTELGVQPGCPYDVTETAISLRTCACRKRQGWSARVTKASPALDTHRCARARARAYHRARMGAGRCVCLAGKLFRRLVCPEGSRAA